MTITETNERVDRSTALEILASLDFEPALPCEHSNHGIKPWHEGPGELVIQFIPNPCDRCGSTGKPGQIMLCRSAWDYTGKRGLVCRNCLATHPREHWWHLVGGV